MKKIGGQNYSGRNCSGVFHTTGRARHTNGEFRTIRAREEKFHRIEPRLAGIPLFSGIPNRRLSNLSFLEKVVLCGTLTSAFSSPLPPDLHERAVNPSLKVLQRRVDALATVPNRPTMPASPRSSSTPPLPPPAPNPRPPVPIHQVEEWGAAMALPTIDGELAPINESYVLPFVSNPRPIHFAYQANKRIGTMATMPARPRSSSTPPVPAHQIEEWGITMEPAPIDESCGFAPPFASLEAKGTEPLDTAANSTAMGSSIPELREGVDDASENVCSGASARKRRKSRHTSKHTTTERTGTRRQFRRQSQNTTQSGNTTAAIAAGIEEVAKMANLMNEKTRLEEENRNLTDTGRSRAQIRKNKQRIRNLKRQIVSAGGRNSSALRGMEPAMVNISTILATAIKDNRLSRDVLTDTLAHISATYRQDGILMGRLEYFYRRFSQFQENEALFNEFIGIANSYGDPADRVKFIYNALIYPYQKSREGSCFATSILDTMWANDPSGYMRFVDKLIREDRADFNAFFLGSNRSELSIDVRGIGIRAGSDAIYQKVVSALALLSIHSYEINVVKDSIYDVCLRKINETNEANKMGMGNEIMRVISNAIATNLTDKIVWDRQWTPDINVTRSLNETAITEAMGSYIMDILSGIQKAARMGKSDAQVIADAIRQADGKIGGCTELLIENLLNLPNGGAYDVAVNRITNPARDAIFDTADMQPLLQALEFGSSPNPSCRLKPGQAIVAGTQDHAFTLTSGHYDVDAMSVGEEVRIGHANYVGFPRGESFIYLKKISPIQVQLTCGPNRTPLDSEVEELVVYPNVFTKYEYNP